MPNKPPPEFTPDHAWELAQNVYHMSRWNNPPPEPQILLTPSELVEFFRLATIDMAARNEAK